MLLDLVTALAILPGGSAPALGFWGVAILGAIWIHQWRAA